MGVEGIVVAVGTVSAPCALSPLTVHPSPPPGEGGDCGGTIAKGAPQWLPWSAAVERMGVQLTLRL